MRAGERSSSARSLDRDTREATLTRREKAGYVRCLACGHRCLIKDGLRGICKVRFNQGGVLYAPWGYVAALHSDPTEKKPFFHVLPGSQTMTFGMLGCDFHCPFCQNWLSSQTLRDPASIFDRMQIQPEELVQAALDQKASLVASSYNEPLITTEWAVDVFKLAKRKGLRTLFVSNGNGNREVLEYLRPWLDGYKIDLKSMSDRNYRRLGGTLDRVLETVKTAVEMGFWVEVVTLVVPGFNDSTEELRDAARFLISVSPSIPWHVTAFHRDYQMTDSDNTSPQTLRRAAEIGKEEGLQFVYAGNLPSLMGGYEDTQCPSCHHLLVRRHGYFILSYDVTEKGTCPGCGASIPGLWWGSGAA